MDITSSVCNIEFKVYFGRDICHNAASGVPNRSKVAYMVRCFWSFKTNQTFNIKFVVLTGLPFQNL